MMSADSKRMTAKRLRVVAAIAAVWTAVALLFAAREIINQALPVRAWPECISWHLLEWYVMGLFTPMVLWVTHRARPRYHGWLRILGLHLTGVVAYTLLSTYLYFSCARLLRVLTTLTPPVSELVALGLRRVLLLWMPFDFIIYAAIAAVVYALDYSGRYHERELRASQLEGDLAEAQLRVLRSQIHPHFLFNTLNSISALLRKDPEMAERMIARLADLLRSTLDSGADQEVPLQQELTLLQTYLDIQKMRFGERLRVETKVASDASAELVPNLILQPVVENAIRHGIAPRATGGTVEIRACCEAGGLVIDVIDDGPGFGESRHVSEGIGISNTRERLHQLYGMAGFLTIGNAPAGGAWVRLHIPLRRSLTHGAAIAEPAAPIEKADAYLTAAYAQASAPVPREVR